MTVLADQIESLDRAAAIELRGTVEEVRGMALRVADLPVPIGAAVTIQPRGRSANVRDADRHVSGGLQGEVVGFDREQTIVMPFGATAGVRAGDHVTANQYDQTINVGVGLLGRVVNAFGQPIDGGDPIRDTRPRSIQAQPTDPMDRPLIDTPLATGVRAVDTLVPIGRGQRMGVFAAPGVGKSTVLGMMARQTEADVSVIALVGERGREVREFIENTLGDEGLKNSVVICATGDEPALLRVRAAMAAATIAEAFRDEGKDVLFIMDSVTRFCQAQREIGLAVGEPPATRGYPPSVFSMLPRLLERSGRAGNGSITGIYAVLVEGDDIDEPISDAARGILDGHLVLSRHLANRGHWPAIDVPASISRVSEDIIDDEHAKVRQQIVRLISDYREVEDLVNIGAYAPGSNPDFDLAIACKDVIEQLVRQGRHERTGDGTFGRARDLLMAVAQQVENARAEIARFQRQVQQQQQQQARR